MDEILQTKEYEKEQENITKLGENQVFYLPYLMLSLIHIFNTTDSAVRLTHYPTGIVIYSQTEKSQLQNKEKAFRLLRSKLYELELEKQQSAEAEARRSQIGTGDRSEKIRTYNFPQVRVTEHRIKLTLYKIDNIMNGDLDEIIDSLIAADPVSYTHLDVYKRQEKGKCAYGNYRGSFDCTGDGNIYGAAIFYFRFV